MQCEPPLQYLYGSVDGVLRLLQLLRTVTVLILPEQIDIPDLRGFRSGGYNALQTEPVAVVVHRQGRVVPEPHAFVGAHHAGICGRHVLHVTVAHFNAVLLHVHLFIQIGVDRGDVIAFQIVLDIQLQSEILRKRTDKVPER